MARSQAAQAQGATSVAAGAEVDAQVGGGFDDDGAFEGEEAALLGDVRADDGLAGNGGIFLLDEALGEFHHGGIFIGAVIINDVLGIPAGV